MRISGWSSDVFSSDLSTTPLYNLGSIVLFYHDEFGISIARYCKFTSFEKTIAKATPVGLNTRLNQHWVVTNRIDLSDPELAMGIACPYNELVYSGSWYGWVIVDGFVPAEMRSEEHTSELQSLMRISYAVFCLKKKKTKQNRKMNTNTANKQTTNTDIKYKQTI